MKTLLGFLMLTLLGSTACHATTYYMSPTGNDGNSGLSTATPWLSPNHNVNCGDYILASAGTYPSMSSFGTVNCPAGNNVAWLRCALFATCKVSVDSDSPSYAAIRIGKSYWGVRNWEVTTSVGAGSCFVARPETSSESIHHIIFANDVANGCGQGGLSITNNGSAGVDYFAVVGSIAYNSIQGSKYCSSAIGTLSPVASDNQPGTHIYIAGNFSFDNVEPPVCNGETSTDGQGIFFDTTTGYSEQMVIDNNISIFNGAAGLKTYANSGSHPATIIFRNNTTYGNQASNVADPCTEVLVQASYNTEVYGNLSMTATENGCSPTQGLYVLGIAQYGNSTDKLYSNFAYSAWGNNTTDYRMGLTFGPNNIYGVNPEFANPVKPPAPTCDGHSNAIACMAQVIADYKPANSQAKSYGYHVPGNTPVVDPLFPKWLCNVNLPQGLVNEGCSE